VYTNTKGKLSTEGEKKVEQQFGGGKSRDGGGGVSHADDHKNQQEKTGTGGDLGGAVKKRQQSKSTKRGFQLKQAANQGKGIKHINNERDGKKKSTMFGVRTNPQGFAMNQWEKDALLGERGPKGSTFGHNRSPKGPRKAKRLVRQKGNTGYLELGDTVGLCVGKKKKNNWEFFRGTEWSFGKKVQQKRGDERLEKQTQENVFLGAKMETV